MTDSIGSGPSETDDEGMTPLVRAALAHGLADADGDASGHDRHHVQLVFDMARHLAVAEDRADLLELVGIEAALHDVQDFKKTRDPLSGARAAETWLLQHGADPDLVNSAASDLAGISFKGAHVPTRPLSKAGQLVQDADRLQAIGATGIARCFTYGGSVGRAIHDPEAPVLLAESVEEYLAHQGTSVGHFHEKLLLVKDRLHTDSARKIAADRHQFLLTFLEQLKDEWEGRR